jgi:transcriptional regulator with XRE-family HTH domain
MTLKQLVNGTGRSHAELARELGVHPVSLSRWINGAPPRDVVAPALAAVLGCSVDAVRTALAAERALRPHAGIAIDTPEQTRAVLADRATAPASGPAVGPGAEGAGGVVHAGEATPAGAA